MSGEYDIPLSDIYEEGGGKRLVVTNDGVRLVDRTTEKPYGVVSLRDGDIDRLIHLLIAYRSETVGAYEPFNPGSGLFDLEQYKEGGEE